ncbi:MAG TPA: adenylate/guanylate cyclase domain-containing protein [Deltaproteobacteria bacterium]|nr:adenylate/guanylate cyclase domain-containing protein [Deltaproteobacteria bacterium]
MAALSKNLTVMFVDIKGYTSRSYSQTREQNQKLLQAFVNTVRPIIEKYSGEVVKGLGDALLAAFESSTDAVLSGIAIQEKIDQINLKRSETSRFEVRVAMSTGDVRIENNDIFGDAVNLASRIEGLTPENEIYFSESVFHTMNKNEIPHQEVGQFEVRGFSSKVTVYKALWKSESTAPGMKRVARKTMAGTLSAEDADILPEDAIFNKPDLRNLDITPLTQVDIHNAIEKVTNILCSTDEEECLRPQIFAMQATSYTKAPEPFFTYAILNLFRFAGFLGNSRFSVWTRPSMFRSVDIKTNEQLVKELSKTRPEFKNIPFPYRYKQNATSVHVSWNQNQDISGSSFLSHWEQLTTSGTGGMDISVYDFFRILLKSGATIRFDAQKGGKQNVIVKVAETP